MAQVVDNMSDCQVIQDLDDLIESEQKFACVYADVPWSFRNTSSRAAAATHYQTMSYRQLRELPVRELVADNAHLHFWVPNALLPESFDIMKAWGFQYKTNFAWVKPQIGMGNYWRNAHELMLLGVRGSLPFGQNNVKSWLEVRRTSHSTKPDAIRELVEQVSPGPYLELFGRRTVPGWTTFGNQIERWLF